MTYEEAEAVALAAEDAAYAANTCCHDCAAKAAVDAYAEAKAKFYAAESQPKGIIWDSEPEKRCDCGGACTNCRGLVK